MNGGQKGKREGVSVKQNALTLLLAQEYKPALQKGACGGRGAGEREGKAC